MANLSFLFAAYTIVWAGVLVYVVGLARRSRSLERDLDELRKLVSRRQL